jgi:tryptophan 2,3-dioxygenase
LEGIESYGLYVQFADMLHTVGGYQEYDFKKISLMLGHTKKNIKAKLGRVINDYELFEFYTDDDGKEMVGLERLKEDIASLNKHKINGAKGGKKRAENYRSKSLSKDSKPKETVLQVSQPVQEIPEATEYEVASFFYDYKYRSQLDFLIKRPFSPRANQQVYKYYMLKTYPDKREEIENSI